MTYPLHYLILQTLLEQTELVDHLREQAVDDEGLLVIPKPTEPIPTL